MRCSTCRSRRASTRPTATRPPTRSAARYVDDDKLELSAWARDAVVLALPDKILCRPDCAGLCAVCGENLNERPHEHEDAPGDDRWAALAELRDRL